MMRRVRFLMDCIVVPDILMIPPAVLACTLRGQVPGGFFSMVVLVFAGYFHALKYHPG
jgi:hypothetical protein